MLCYWVEWVLYIVWIQPLIRYIICKFAIIFSHFIECHFPDGLLCCSESVWFNVVPFLNICSCCLVLLRPYPKTHCQENEMKFKIWFPRRGGEWSKFRKEEDTTLKGSFWQRMSFRAPLKPVKEHFCHGNIYPVCLHSSNWPLTSNLGHYLQSQYCWVVLNNFLCFDFLNNLLLP